MSPRRSFLVDQIQVHLCRLICPHPLALRILAHPLLHRRGVHNRIDNDMCYMHSLGLNSRASD